jgi:hypothetical protein
MHPQASHRRGAGAHAPLAKKEGSDAMLGRKSYTREEFDHCKGAIDQQLAAYKTLVKAIGSATADNQVNASIDAFEKLFFNNMILVLDRPFVHRVRMVTGKDGNPLNEVEMLADSLMSNEGILRDSNVIKLIPDQSVTKLQIGDPIKLSEEQFERLTAAFFSELERKFL